jgi:hypothetical protein
MIFILNSVFTIVLYVMRWTKQDLIYICFEEFLNQLNLFYSWICLIFLCFEDFLNQLNLFYIWICLYLQQIKIYEHAS